MSTGLSSRTARPSTERRPSLGRLGLDQLRFTLTDLWRARLVVIFTLVLPLTWLVVLGFLAGNDVLDGTSGIRVMQVVTPSAATMGVLFAAFPTVATAVAVARERGVLRRVRGTPLPAGVYLGAKVVSAALVAVAAYTLMLLVGVLVYDVQVFWRTVPAMAVTVLVATAAFAALGLAVAALARSGNTAQAVAIGLAVTMSFLSGLFTVGEMPAWMQHVADVLPVGVLLRALQGQLDPFSTGSGWDGGALAVLVVWGAGATAVTLRTFRWEPAADRTSSRGRRATTHPAPGPTPNSSGASRRPAGLAVAEAGRPGPVSLVVAQTAAATRAAMRDPGWLFFAVAMPLGLFVLNAGMSRSAGGDPDLVAVLAAGMIAFGTAVTAFVNLPEAVATARDRGVLKRLRGTPTPAAAYLAGRILSALWTALLTAVLVVGLGVLFFGLTPTWPGLLLAGAFVVLGAVTLGACGFALAGGLPDAKAVGAVGLGVLLPASFFSDVFVVNPPQWMSTVGSVLPLQHVVRLLDRALDPAGTAVAWGSFAVVVVWLVGASLIALRTFRWDARGDHDPGRRPHGR